MTSHRTMRAARVPGRAIVAAFLVALCCLWQGAHAQGGTESRLALVIGNSSYKNAPLLNPVNDARLMETALREAGFEVMKAENATLREMRRLVRDFGDRLKASGGVGLFYYAGHGVQVRGENYLVSVDSDIRNEDEVADDAINAQLVLEKMQSAGNRMNLIVLDACRNNPFAVKSRAAVSGLATMNAPSGSLVAYSTAPGAVAEDGAGANSLYTKHLARIGAPARAAGRRGVQAGARRGATRQQQPPDAVGEHRARRAVLLQAVAARASHSSLRRQIRRRGARRAGRRRSADGRARVLGQRQEQHQPRRSCRATSSVIRRACSPIWRKRASLRCRRGPRGRRLRVVATAPATAPPKAPAAPPPLSRLRRQRRRRKHRRQRTSSTPPRQRRDVIGSVVIKNLYGGQTESIEVRVVERSNESIKYSSGDVIASDGQVLAVRIGTMVGRLQSGTLWKVPLQVGASGRAQVQMQDQQTNAQLDWRVVDRKASRTTLEVRLIYHIDTSGRNRSGTWSATYEDGVPVATSFKLETRSYSTPPLGGWAGFDGGDVAAAVGHRMARQRHPTQGHACRPSTKFGFGADIADRKRLGCDTNFGRQAAPHDARDRAGHRGELADSPPASSN